MEPLTVRKEIVIDAPPERVWPYVGTQEGYSRWSCTVAEVHDVMLRPARTITITLSEQAGRTRVTVEETGFELLPVEERDRIFKSNDAGWAAAMEDLRALLAREVVGGLEPLSIRKEGGELRSAAQDRDDPAGGVARRILVARRQPRLHLPAGRRWPHPG